MSELDRIFAALDEAESIERQQEEAWRSLPDRLLTDDVRDTCGCPRLRTDEAGAFPVDTTDIETTTERDMT